MIISTQCFFLRVIFFSFVSQKPSTGAEGPEAKSISAIHNAAVITSNVQTRSMMRDLLSEDERPQREAALADSGLAWGRGDTSLLCLKLWFVELQSSASRLVNRVLVNSVPRGCKKQSQLKTKHRLKTHEECVQLLSLTTSA